MYTNFIVLYLSFIIQQQVSQLCAIEIIQNHLKPLYHFSEIQYFFKYNNIHQPSLRV